MSFRWASAEFAALLDFLGKLIGALMASGGAWLGIRAYARKVRKRRSEEAATLIVQHVDARLTEHNSAINNRFTLHEQVSAETAERLSRRIDAVADNVTALDKQLSTSNGKLEVIHSILVSRQFHGDDDGQDQ